MKKLLSLIVLMLISAGFVFANSDGGYFNENSFNKKMTVEEALKQKDNSYVTIKGNIVKRISGDTYIFEDSTGTINVEIDANKWQGIFANKRDKLELSGEIERDFDFIKLDVDNVRRIP